MRGQARFHAAGSRGPEFSADLGLGEDWVAWCTVGALETGVTKATVEMGKCFES